MRVDAATLGLVFSGISALVVIVGAIAAVHQIQHIRRGNELAAITKFVDEWSSAEFTADRLLVRDELPAMLREYASIDAFRNDPRSPRVFRVLHFFERLAFFVRRGAISDELAMELFANAATQQWELTREFIIRLRDTYHTNAAMEWFEDFAMRAPEWSERNEHRSKHLRRDPKVASRRDQPPSPGPSVPSSPPALDEGVPAPET
ncbi:MAG TPA: hypothetical protein VGC96_14670 [Candidatus Elarobacter sp.]|jgi:hypothetical protein